MGKAEKYSINNPLRVMIYFTDLDFQPFSGKKNCKYSWKHLSPEIHHLEKKTGERIFKL